jgi:hypothetical protein
VASENVADLIMDGKESLHLPWRLEAFHDPLSSSLRLVRILCPIVEGFMLACSTPGMISRLAGSAAAQFVADQHTRRPHQGGAAFVLPNPGAAQPRRRNRRSKLLSRASAPTMIAPLMMS